MILIGAVGYCRHRGGPVIYRKGAETQRTPRKSQVPSIADLSARGDNQISFLISSENVCQIRQPEELHKCKKIQFPEAHFPDFPLPKSLSHDTGEHITGKKTCNGDICNGHEKNLH